MHLSLKQFLRAELPSRTVSSATEAAAERAYTRHDTLAGKNPVHVPWMQRPLLGMVTKATARLLPLYSHQPATTCIARFPDLRPS